jgi:two-component sensor histidine kinase
MTVSDGVQAIEGPECVCWPDPDRSPDDPAYVRAVRDAEPGAVRQLRRLVRDWVADAGVDEDTADAIVLIVDEAVTNAVEHACSEGGEGTCHVELIAGPRACGGGIAVLVGDDGVWRNPPEDPGSRGRGVQLMGRLADRSSITTGEDGTSVRMCWGTTG